jgi:hypothetical protein
VPTISLERTLVKSPPELWEELSQLEQWLGEVEIMRQEPPSHLTWSARGAHGTIDLEPSGWGTKVRASAKTGGGGLFERFRVADDAQAIERRLTELLDHLGSSSLKRS